MANETTKNRIFSEKAVSTVFYSQQDIAIRIAELVDAYTNYKSGQFSRASDLGDRLAELYRALTAVYIATRPFLIEPAQQLNKLELLRALDGLTDIDPNVDIKEVKDYVIVDEKEKQIYIKYGTIIADLFYLLKVAGVYDLTYSKMKEEEKWRTALS